MEPPRPDWQQLHLLLWAVVHLSVVREAFLAALDYCCCCLDSLDGVQLRPVTWADPVLSCCWRIGYVGLYVKGGVADG